MLMPVKIELFYISNESIMFERNILIVFHIASSSS
jgi:hypothetical protein